MLIAQILAGKGSEVVSTRPEATIAEVAGLLKEKRIGAVVVTDADGALCGIISERDLARGLANHGRGSVERKPPPGSPADGVTGSPDDGHEKLMQTMTEGRFRHLPVVKD